MLTGLIFYKRLDKGGFDLKWVKWIEYILWGGGRGYGAVLLNGAPDNYFECRKGVRQGDPLFSYLFLLSAEGLNKILFKGIALGQFEGLVLLLLMATNS
jgi:hypothetical protein